MNPESVAEHLFNISADIGEIKANGVATLTEARRTNGRVTKLEEVVVELKEAVGKISLLISRHNGDLLKHEQIHDDIERLFGAEIERVEQSVNSRFEKWNQSREERLAEEQKEEKDGKRLTRENLWRLFFWAITLATGLIIGLLGYDIGNVPVVPGN